MRMHGMDIFTIRTLRHHLLHADSSNTAGSKIWYIIRIWNKQVWIYFDVILWVLLGMRCLILSGIAVALSFLCTFQFLNNLSECNEICAVAWLLNLTLSWPILFIHLPGMSTVLTLNVFISGLFVFTTTTTLLPRVICSFIILILMHVCGI